MSLATAEPFKNLKGSEYGYITGIKLYDYRWQHCT